MSKVCSNGTSSIASISFSSAITGALFPTLIGFASNVSFGTATITDFAGTVTLAVVSFKLVTPAFVPSETITQLLEPASVTLLSDVALLIRTATLFHSPDTLFVS